MTTTTFKKGTRVHIINPLGKDGKPKGMIPECVGTVKAVYKTGKIAIHEATCGKAFTLPVSGFKLHVQDFRDMGGIIEEVYSCELQQFDILPTRT